MTKMVNPHGAPDADQAINVVLQAERDAREAIAACQDQAETILEEARARARAIQERTGKRITRLHSECAHATEQRVKRLLQEDGHTQEPLTPEDESVAQALNNAIERVAARLSGSEDQGPSSKAS